MRLGELLHWGGQTSRRMGGQGMVAERARSVRSPARISLQSRKLDAGMQRMGGRMAQSLKRANPRRARCSPMDDAGVDSSRQATRCLGVCRADSQHM